MIWLEIAYLLLLHDPAGREVRVNPNQVTALRPNSPASAADKGLLHQDVQCVVNLADGKYVAVTESCGEIMDLMAATGQER